MTACDVLVERNLSIGESKDLWPAETASTAAWILRAARTNSFISAARGTGRLHGIAEYAKFTRQAGCVPSATWGPGGIHMIMDIVFFCYDSQDGWPASARDLSGLQFHD